MKSAKTPQEARAKPGRKLLTPLEHKQVAKVTKEDRERWSALFAAQRNRAIANGRAIQ
jgi:hypothetical protein